MSALRPQTIVLAGLDRIGFRFRYAGKSEVANNYYNRQELADYLEADRSGLSVEIGKLCRQGVITAERNRFQVIANIV